MTNDIDFNAITTAAYSELLNQKIDVFPINPFKFKFENNSIIISSLQKYCRLTRTSIERATNQGFFDDGYSVKNLRPGLKLILYNEMKYDPRMRFTILHEIGHIRLGHTKHGVIEEKEANFYASQVIAPNVLLKEISRRGYAINIGRIMSAFGISKECADKKMDYLCRYPQTHNELDTAVLEAFKRYMFFCVPVRLNCSIDVEVD